MGPELGAGLLIRRSQVRALIGEPIHEGMQVSIYAAPLIRVS
jgi:hypothetical protein